MTGLVQTALKRFEFLRHESEKALAAQGSACASSGCLLWNSGKLAIHTDFGPAGQDKDVNQDFGVAWVASEHQDLPSVRWAIALADGVTSSYFAEVGSEIACWMGLAALISQKGEPADRARQAIASAGKAIGAIGDVIENEAEVYRPAGEFSSTWRFALREGLLLQTTLSLAWLEGEVIYVAFVGDGGAVIQRGVHEGRVAESVGELDEGTSRVHALGPRNREVSTPDAFHQFELDGVTRMALFTDGVGRGLYPTSQSVFDEADEMEGGEFNIAKGLIERWSNRRAEAFDDNLSLVLVTEAQQET